MSESQRLRLLLKEIQTKVHSLGSTNKSRWAVFSDLPEMSQSQFTTRVNTYGIKASIQDTATMWRAAGISGHIIQFSDFVRLLQAETAVIAIEPPSPIARAVNILEVLRKNRKTLLEKLTEYDPDITGVITVRCFSEILSWFGAEGDMSVSIHKYDPTNSGRIKYFPIMAEVCEMDPMSAPQYRPQPALPAETPPLDVSFTSAPERTIKDSQSTYEIPQQTQKRNVSGSGPRQNLDPLIFPTLSKSEYPSSVSPHGGRGTLDPAIFGQRPISAAVPEQHLSTADECTGAEHMDGLSPEQIVSQIAKQTGRIFKSSRQAFEKWRGARSDYLTATLLRDGLARDANIVLNANDLNDVIRHYGTNLSLSGFVRMLADGTKFDSTGGMRQDATDEEVILEKIASQVKGDEWQDVIYKSSTSSEAAQQLEQLGIKVNLEDLHRLLSKWGKSGLVSSILDKTGVRQGN